ILIKNGYVVTVDGPCALDWRPRPGLRARTVVVLNAVRCNPWLRQYYERLRAAGKPGKVAVIAAMRKLLTAVWSVATHRKPFVPHLPGVSAPLGAVTCKA